MYWEYFKYVVRHKWYVMLACFRVGLYWRGIVHDLSKFRPVEFGPYARHFYGVKTRTGYKKPKDTGDPDFEAAWQAHVKVNPHHWEHWISKCERCDGTGIGVNNPLCTSCSGAGAFIRLMPDDVALEMLCDWVGAGKAQGHHSPPDNPYLETRQWYAANEDSINLHGYTRKFVEWWMTRSSAS